MDWYKTYGVFCNLAHELGILLFLEFCSIFKHGILAEGLLQGLEHALALDSGRLFNRKEKEFLHIALHCNHIAKVLDARAGEARYQLRTVLCPA